MPIGAGGMSGLNCHASPPSPSGTTFGALSWNLRGRYCFQTCGGSRMCESAEMRWYSRAMPGPSARSHTNKRSFTSRGRRSCPPGNLLLGTQRAEKLLDGRTEHLPSLERLSTSIDEQASSLRVVRRERLEPAHVLRTNPAGVLDLH